ncbi:MAG: DegT/DnrJ/EryC1/StrS family aminotransferase [Desulfovibrio sp.]
MAEARVPFFGVAREYAACGGEMLPLIERVLSSGGLLQGAEVTAFEQELAAYCGRAHAVAVGSCTDALFFSLVSAGVKGGDEVLVPDFSFVASASCILRTGATPVFCDVDEWGNMDLAKAAARVTARTKAVVFVHLYGRMGKPEAVEAFAREHGLTLIEDAAQAIGAAHGDRKAGSMGLAGCISFDPTKPLCCLGSGGAVVTDDVSLAEDIRSLRYHGRDMNRKFARLGYNSQMPSASAAILRYKLRQDPAWGDRRREIAARYCDGLEPLGLAVQREEPGTRHIYHKYVVKAGRRDELAAHLRGQGIEVMVHYTDPLHAHPMFAEVLPKGGVDSPAARALAATALSLPMHPWLDEADISAVLEAVKGFYK